MPLTTENTNFGLKNKIITKVQKSFMAEK